MYTNVCFPAEEKSHIIYHSLHHLLLRHRVYFLYVICHAVFVTYIRSFILARFSFLCFLFFLFIIYFCPVCYLLMNLCCHVTRISLLRMTRVLNCSSDSFKPSAKHKGTRRKKKV